MVAFELEVHQSVDNYGRDGVDDSGNGKPLVRLVLGKEHSDYFERLVVQADIHQQNQQSADAGHEPHRVVQLRDNIQLLHQTENQKQKEARSELAYGFGFFGVHRQSPIFMISLLYPLNRRLSSDAIHAFGELFADR